MFSILFGLHFALRALIDLILRDDGRNRGAHGVQLQNAKVAAECQNEKQDTNTSQLTFDRGFKVRNNEGTANIPSENSAGFKTVHPSKYKSQKDRTLIVTKSNNSSSSNGRDNDNVQVIEESFTSQYVAGAQSSKNTSGIAGDAGSKKVDVIVPVQEAQLSAIVTKKDEFTPKQHGRVIKSRKQMSMLPDSNKTVTKEVTEHVIVPVKDTELSTVKVRQHRQGSKSRKQMSALPDSNKTVTEKVIEHVIVPVKDAELSTVDAKQDVKKSVDVTKVYGYQEMPYLSDEATINYVKHSHTMFIMRGLPGSGKSVLVKCLQEIYQDVAVVCSADHFFYNSDGTYNFDAGKLSEAHKFCQDKAAFHCDEGTPVVIIDNTNIQRWEMSTYVKLAQNRSYYHIVIVEPLTPWRHDPDELARRNKHNVDGDLIAKKLRSLRDNACRPYYYGWFICIEDSSFVVKKSREVLKQCIDEILFPSLGAEDVSDSFTSLEEILSNVVISYTDPVPMLHCTAAYLARRAKDAYHTEETVVQSLGKTFKLCISGFVYSREAISARVALLDNSDESGFCDSSDSMSLGAVSKRVSGHTDITSKLYMKPEEEKLREKYGDVSLNSSDGQAEHALFNHGCSAHVTISYANDGQAKLSGENLLNILELEFYGKVKQARSKVGLVSAYGKDMFQIQLNEPIEVRSLFQGFYSNRR